MKKLIFSLFLLSCADAIYEEAPPPHAWDLIEIGSDGTAKADGINVSSNFDPAWIVSDHFFNNTQSVSVNNIQHFFENSPYGRSWLADATFEGITASQIIYDVALEYNLNPLMLIVRMQVEKSLISTISKPSNNRINYAMGCGCHDYQSCNASYRGFTNQIKCAAATMRRLYEESQNKTNEWTAGQPHRTLDGAYITPANHSTASLYAYTPWVLRNRGGNWLVWNVTLKMYTHLLQIDKIAITDNTCMNTLGRKFIGDPCLCDSDCGFFENGQAGFCHIGGFCSIPCDGYCPDLRGRASTFCAVDLTQSNGICVSKSSTSNGHCADLEKTVEHEVNRFVLNSGASQTTAEVCMPLE